MTFEYDSEDEVLRGAEAIVRARKLRRGATLKGPDDTKRWIELALVSRTREVFACLFLSNRHQVIAFEEMFWGTIDGASVYPREVIKRVIHHNAAAVIFVHNHPSGVAEPSQADISLTRRLKEVLALVDVRTLDHIVVGDETVSMSEKGII